MSDSGEAEPGEPQQGSRAPARRRRAAAVTGAALAAVLVAVGGFWLLDRSAGPAHTAAGTTPTPSAGSRVPTSAQPSTDPYAAERRTALPALLRRRGEAVVARDEKAFLALLDPKASATFRSEQARTFANLEEIGFSRWGYDIVSDLPAGGQVEKRVGAPARVVHVTLRYRIAGFDPGDVLRSQYLTVVRRDGSWLVDSDADGFDDSSQRDLWDLGRVTVVHGKRNLVIARSTGRDLARYAAEADAAIGSVSKVVGSSWPQRTVVEVPGSESDLETILGRIDKSISIDSYAAVAFPEPSDSRSGGKPLVPTRVALNPVAFDQMDKAMSRAVLTHEMTHVAWFGVGGEVAQWLQEGFADYVGFLGYPTDVVAPDVTDAVRAGHLPSRVPTAGDFQHSDTVDTAYEQSATLCRAIAAKWGQAKLVALYRAAATSSNRDEDAATVQAARSVLGVSQDQLVSAWRAYLRAQLR